MSEQVVDERCVECGHTMGLHFQDVLGKVRCLAVSRSVSRMTGDLNEESCSCVDYALQNEWQRKLRDQRAGR